MAKNNYFDNPTIEKAIAKYQKTVNKDPDDKGDVEILQPYTDQFRQLVKAVINTHKIYRFHNDIEELQQEGFAALYASFKRFDNSKGSAFNYLSIVVKQHLKNWTQNKNKKDWVTKEFNEEIYDSNDAESSYDLFALKETLSEIKVEGNLEQILERVVALVLDDQIYNKRDVVKVLLKEGWVREDINAVYELLEDRFSGDDYEG